ncbi:MAG: M1 family metallopeptidase [Terriglobia bacterium]|jgi:alanyl aminopeptidase
MRRFVHKSTVVLIAVCTLAILYAWNAKADQAPDQPPIPPKFRLPARDVGPVRYRLDLTVVPDQDTFIGAVEIDLQLAKSTSVLWLNGERLTVKDATLTVGHEKLAAKVISEPQDYVGFAFDHPIGPGEATLRVVYQGEISRKDQQGIFQMKDGDRWYVYSQFEAIWARRAFPCFDEPSYKVPWQLTLRVKKDQVALSNAPMVSETDSGDGMKAVEFAETKPLPSYLVAIAVGDLEFVDAGAAGKKNTRVRIVVPRGRGSEAKYAAETTPAIVNLLEDYFGIPYPYDKLDEVAIPLYGGAMENAGFVTYGSGIILAKPEQDTPSRQREWVWVAAHELAHQWFGDLVTTAWWDDIWLNEGFASWTANKIVNDYHPEWHADVEALNSYQGAMQSDSLVSARRVRQPIESKDDIVNAFDSITYDKGSGLLNMFESYMGGERFRAGIRRYLTKYSWKNATSAEFLTALAGDDTSVAAAFSTFLDQPGVPLVMAALDCSGGAAKLKLSQQRFLPLGSVGSADQIWEIPLCVRYPTGQREARQCELLSHQSAQLQLAPGGGCPAWVEANAGAAGYYFGLYEGNLLNALLQDDAQVLTLPEKVGLVGNLSSLTRSGKIPLGRALALAPSLAQDPARQVVTKTMEITTGLQDNLVSKDLLPRYRQYLLDVYGGRARDLGWKTKAGESEDARLLRPALLRVLANQGQDSELIAQAKKLALAWLDDHKAVDPDMVGVVLTTAARYGDRDLFDRMHAAAKKEKEESFRGTLLFSLGSFQDPEILKAALPIVLSDEFDSRESFGILFAPAQRRQTRDFAYDFVKQNWDRLIAKLPTDSGSFLPYVAGGYCDSQHRQDVESFFSGRSTKYTGGPRILTQVLEGIDLCVAYKNAQEASVAEFLETYRPAQSVGTGSPYK